jgi:hypothetical protein
MQILDSKNTISDYIFQVKTLECEICKLYSRWSIQQLFDSILLTGIDIE